MKARTRLKRRILRDHRSSGQKFLARLTCHMGLIYRHPEGWLEEWGTWSCPRCAHKHDRKPRAYR